MDSKKTYSFILVFFFFQYSSSALKKSYIIYLGTHAHGPDITSLDRERVRKSHYELLGSHFQSKKKAREAIFYSYTNYINGFAAVLEEGEAADLSKHVDVISVSVNQARYLQTTRSWQFLGLENHGTISEESIWTKARFGEDVIIANLDTGVWPESQSFNDEGYGPIPSRWKGTCQEGVVCNNKLIGARYFSQGFESSFGAINSSQLSPRDFDGHGTHTLATAGGNFVSNANVLGYGNGTAKGGAPRARVVAYKVCWEAGTKAGCTDSDILAAFDWAIRDGVDLISVSLGGENTAYLLDSTAIGSFHAVMNGIPVVVAAGNSGPDFFTVENVAPWLLTVGASTIDREFPSYVTLENGEKIKGQSLSDKTLTKGKFYPLIASKEAARSNTTKAEVCELGSLDPEKVKGKIVVCLRGVIPREEKGLTVLQAGGVGMILCNNITDQNQINADTHVLPATHVGYSDGVRVYSYINSTISAGATISAPITVLDTKPAPVMAAFSSRGPNVITPDILKPDITAPGVNIIAAYSEGVSPTNLDFDTRRLPFNAISGTSMSCPHVSGIIGLLKTLYPNWSPAALRSAVMTSARTNDNINEPIEGSSGEQSTPFAFGSGHIDPHRAMDPGLVYDLTGEDYLNFLCSVGYNGFLQIFTSRTYNCSESLTLLNFNYPSITVLNLSSTVTVSRRLKNVGSPATYTVRIEQPSEVTVKVEPQTLKFTKIGEEKVFRVIVEAKTVKRNEDYYVFGRLTWSDGVHNVSSPIVLKLS